VEAFIKPSQVGEARRETDHIDMVKGGVMQPRNLLWTHFMKRCDFFQIRTILTPIANRDFDDLRKTDGVILTGSQAFFNGEQEVFKRTQPRIILDEKGAVGRVQSQYAASLPELESAEQLLDSPVDSRIDLVSKFNADSGVAAKQDAGFLKVTHPILPCSLKRFVMMDSSARPKSTSPSLTRPTTFA
jgi:hypothetical protein